MLEVHGYAAQSATSPLLPFSFFRREIRQNDLRIDVLFSGVCHSDIHTAHGDWDGSIYPHGTVYPCVPGHEIVGRVIEIGSDVRRFAVGDLVGVGTMVDSCQECPSCKSGLEQYCDRTPTWTYNSPDRITGENTYGGYADSMIAREEFVLKISHRDEYLPAVAPLLCAGITMWSPLRHWGASQGTTVGIVGIGGLGHMGIKLAHALGSSVIAFTTSESKRADALALGADEVVVSRNPAEMAKHGNSLDFIVDTVAVSHDLDPFDSLLKLNGSMVLVGIPAKAHPSPSIANLIGRRRSLAGSNVGGIHETQEMLDFCAQHDVIADIETIRIQDIEAAYARMVKNDVKYRFVIDMASVKSVSANIAKEF
jgi:alcohol dehydrogenase (NADP+)